MGLHVVPMALQLLHTQLKEHIMFKAHKVDWDAGRTPSSVLQSLYICPVELNRVNGMTSGYVYWWPTAKHDNPFYLGTAARVMNVASGHLNDVLEYMQWTTHQLEIGAPEYTVEYRNVQYSTFNDELPMFGHWYGGQCYWRPAHEIEIRAFLKNHNKRKIYA